MKKAASLGLFLAVALAPVAVSACGTIRAGTILKDALKPADALAEETTTSREIVPALGQDVPVTVYRPRDEGGPLPAFVLTAGAVEEGARDPRLVSLARALAAHGATVATPDLPSLRSLELDPDDPARIAAVAAWLAGRRDLAEAGGVTLVGICVGGSYVVLAAAAPDLDPPPRAVIAMGPYFDLARLLRIWMTEGERDAKGLEDPLTRGRRLVLLGNLDALVPEGDREVVAERIRALLDDGKPAPAPALGERAELVLAAAVSGEPISPADADRLLEPVREIVARLSPSQVDPRPRCPVYLLHGESDPIVPVGDSRELARQLGAAGVRVELHVTDVFGHVDAGGSPGLIAAWPLLSFLADALAASGLL